MGVASGKHPWLGTTAPGSAGYPVRRYRIAATGVSGS